MQLNDTKTKFGVISKTLHWLIAFGFLFQFLKVFERINEKQNIITQMIPPWHGSIGAILFVLVSIRIIWSIVQWSNRDNSDKAVKFGHIMLYVFMFLAPASAISLMLSKGRGLAVFGEQIIAKGEPIVWLSGFGSLHSAISLIMIALVFGHAFMAIAHQFGKKEKRVLHKMI